MRNLRTIILESLERPKIESHSVNDGGGINFHTFMISHPSLTDKMEVHVAHHKLKNRANVCISGENTGLRDWEHNANKLGPANIRHMAKQIHSYMPDVKEFRGARETGAKAGRQNDYASIKMKAS